MSAGAEKPGETPAPPDPDAPLLTPAQLKRRARMGVLWLLMRTVVLQLVVLGGTVVLARELEPADFGVFGVAQFVISFFLFFGDAGLGGALIQKKRTPTRTELSSVFHLQLGIALTVLLLGAFGAGGLRLLWTDLPEHAEWVFRALSLGLVLTVLRVVPQILMERELLFGRLAAVEVASQVGFYGGAAVAALMGLGVWSLVIGALLQGVLSTSLVFVLRPWRPAWTFDREALAPILRFGIPFQAKNVVAFINGAITPLYAGAALGAHRLGFLQWSQQTAYFPLKIVGIMGRVTFPLFSRIRDDRAQFAETLGRSLAICAFATFFFIAFFWSMGEPLVRVVFTEKWLPALPLLKVYAAVLAVGFLSPVAASALDAAGKPLIIAKLSVGWTLLNWAVVLVTTPLYGLEGFVYGYAVHVVVGNLAVLVVLRRVIPGVRVLRRVAAPAVASLGVYAFGVWAAPHATGALSFAGCALAAFVVYGLGVALLDARGVKDAFQLVPEHASDEEEE